MPSTSWSSSKCGPSSTSSPRSRPAAAAKMPNLLPYLPLAALVLGFATWWFGIRLTVGVKGRQSTAYPVAWLLSEPLEPFDTVAFIATNRSLVRPVFVRSYGAIGRGSHGQEIKVEEWSGSASTRLDASQATDWEMSFDDLANAGIDLRRG